MVDVYLTDFFFEKVTSDTCIYLLFSYATWSWMLFLFHFVVLLESLYSLLAVQNRDIPDSRPRGYSNTYNRGSRGGSDRYAGGSGATSFSSSGMYIAFWI